MSGRCNSVSSFFFFIVHFSSIFKIPRGFWRAFFNSDKNLIQEETEWYIYLVHSNWLSLEWRIKQEQSARKEMDSLYLFIYLWEEDLCDFGWRRISWGQRERATPRRDRHGPLANTVVHGTLARREPTRNPRLRLHLNVSLGKRMRDPILQLCFRDQEGIFPFFFMFQVFSGNLLL